MSLAWFKTKLLSLLGLFLISFLLVGCGSSGGGSSSSGSNGNGSNGGNGGGGGNSALELQGFKFEYGTLKTTINATNVDITINENFGNQTPTVTHTGVDYSPQGAIDFANLPQIYTIKASNGSTRGYSVIVRRAFTVSNTTLLTNAIDTINGYIKDNKSIKYITILVEKDINLTGNEVRTIPSDWAGNNIIIEKDNSALPNNITITGLTVEGNNTVEFIGVNEVPAATDKELIGFTFDGGVIKNATIEGLTVDITIDYYSNHTTPLVTHTGLYYSPNNTAIDFANIPTTYTIYDDNNSAKSYSVIVRRAITATYEAEFANVINTIADNNLTYITIFVTNNMNFIGTNQINIPATWKGKNIIIKNNSNLADITITGLTVEGDDTIGFIGVKGVPASSDKELTGFTFTGGVLKNATISGTNINITIDYNSSFTTPLVTHTGLYYSPNNTAIDFANLPATYKITANDNSNKTYSVIVRRALVVSSGTALASAINTIIDSNLTYITIFVTNNINLAGANQITIPATWKDKRIVLEKYNSNLADITITGLTVEGDDTIEFINVYKAPALSDKELTSFTFPYNVTKNATISGTDVDITIDYDSNYKTPLVTHTGSYYSPNNTAIDFANLPANYKITANDNSNKTYSVIVRRAFTVSNEAGLSYAIDTINNAINSTSYITILINNNISLSGINQRNITSTWKGKNIILENNSALPNVTISGLKIEGNDTVGLVGVNIKGLIKAVVTSSSHSFALNYDGKLWATGLNNYGQLGLGDTSTRTSFQPVISSLPSDAQIVSIATGYGHSLALDSSGRVWATGYNFVGQLGLGNSGAGTDRNSFQQVTFTGLAPDVKIVAIAAGSFHSLALDSKGKLWGAGENEYGQLGLGDKTNRNSFQLVTSGLISSANITSIAAGSEHSLALDSSGTLWTTGYNFHGQLGLGDNIDQSVFKQVTIFKNAKIDSIAAGYFHSLALDSKGKLWGTGGNEYGQLGLGNIDSQNSFQLITFNGLASNTTIISIAAGSEHSLALDSSGKIWATGLNLYGQLGLGTSGSGMERNSFQPVTFTGLALDAKVVSISAGYSHSLAATSDDKIWSTGMNRYGQLGLGDVAQRSVFTPAPSF